MCFRSKRWVEAFCPQVLQKSPGIGLSYPVVKNVVANVLCEFSHALVNVYLEDDINNRGVYYGERYSKDISNWSLGVGVEVKFGVGKK
jgi:hypothetical protein